MYTIDDVFEEMIEFGFSLEIAELASPFFLRLHNDPRGFRQALLEDEPRIAEKCGVIKFQ
jgi:hypothetical protein